MNRWRNPRLIASLLLSHLKRERVRKSSYDIVMTYNDSWTRSMYESSECVRLFSLLIKEFKDYVSERDSIPILLFLPYLKDETAEQFIRRPEFKDFVDGIGYRKWSTDQMLLNYWVKKEKIPTLNMDWRWNGLFKGIDDAQIPKAYFIHFFLGGSINFINSNMVIVQKG